MAWDPLGLLGGESTGGEAVAGGVLLGPLGFLGGLLGGLGGSSGSESGSGSSGSGTGYQQTDVLGQLMPLFMLALVAYLVVKFLPKLLK
jgi:hypothetical protein